MQVNKEKIVPVVLFYYDVNCSAGPGACCHARFNAWTGPGRNFLTFAASTGSL